MSIINTALFKGFTFDGVNSLDYDIYITGAGVYNAPERAVEKVSVPGRNGDLNIDQGRFENVPVTYAKCGCAAKTQAELAEKVAAFRNALCSRVGYKRLTDDYNKDEYRMAMYVSGLEVEAIAQHRMGTFDIVFDAMPQRFLKSGEVPKVMARNMVPSSTKTESGSIVSIEGTGADKVTSLVAQIEPVQAGSGDPSPTNVRPITGWTAVNVIVSPTTIASDGTTTTTALGRTVYGGTVDVVTGVLTVTWVAARIGALTWGYNSNGNYFYTSSVSKAAGSFNILSDIYATATVDDVTRMGDYHIKGSAANNNLFVTDSRYTTVADFKSANDQRYIYVEAATPQTYQLPAQQVELLTGNNNVWADTGDITITWGDDPYKVVNPTLFASKPLLKVTGHGVLTIGSQSITINGTSSTQVINIDCDTMEAWEMSGSAMIPRNDYIQNAGDDFPKLKPGANKITLGVGITQVVVTPRWWRV